MINCCFFDCICNIRCIEILKLFLFDLFITNSCKIAISDERFKVHPIVTYYLCLKMPLIFLFPWLFAQKANGLIQPFY